MKRLTDPQHGVQKAVEKCIEGITGNRDLKEKLQSNKRNLIFFESQYLAAASAGKLFKLAPVDTTITKDPVVLGEMRKSELIKVYQQYFVPEKKPAREIYDALMNAALEKCPFCGGIGTPRNLDHYLPKTWFPQFAIMPRNLVPSCLDCNLGEKSESFAKSDDEQVIQPYVDDERFFERQWIFAQYAEPNDGSPGQFRYFVQAPLEWCEVDKRRVDAHFRKFGLAKRYAVKAAEGLGTTLAQIQRLKCMGLDGQTICDVLLRPGVDRAPFVNHWQTGKFQALVTFMQSDRA